MTIGDVLVGGGKMLGLLALVAGIIVVFLGIWCLGFAALGWFASML